MTKWKKLRKLDPQTTENTNNDEEKVFIKGGLLFATSIPDVLRTTYYELTPPMYCDHTLAIRRPTCYVATPSATKGDVPSCPST